MAAPEKNVPFIIVKHIWLGKKKKQTTKNIHNITK